MKIALLGTGRMGSEVAAAAAEDGHEVVARLGRMELSLLSDDAAGRIAGADVAVDFTVAEQVPRSVELAARAGVDLVVGTTGWHPHEIDFRVLTDAGHGVVYGHNFSLGVHVFVRLAREAARLADAVGGYDAHVDEIHHRHKSDHPSGTALHLAHEILPELRDKKRLSDGPPEGVADPETLYVTSVRTGEVPGIHVVGLEGGHDRLELRHEARSRSGFARGAVAGAEWIHGRGGVHTFDEVVADLLDRRRTGAHESS